MADAIETCGPSLPNEELRAAFQTLSLLKTAIEAIDYSDLRYDLIWEDDPAETFSDQYIANAKVQIINIKNLLALTPTALSAIENFLNTPVVEDGE